MRTIIGRGGTPMRQIPIILIPPIISIRVVPISSPVMVRIIVGRPPHIIKRPIRQIKERRVKSFQPTSIARIFTVVMVSIVGSRCGGDGITLLQLGVIGYGIIKVIILLGVGGQGKART